MPAQPTLQQVGSSLSSGKFSTAVNSLIAGNSAIEYFTGAGHSVFVANPSTNGIVQGGTIRINTDEVQSTATRENITYDAALDSTIAHEVGHGANANIDAHNVAVTPAALESYCYTREGEAAAFEFQVALENHQAGGSLQVAGVDGTPDLYYDMLATYTTLSATIDPRSNAFQTDMVDYATTLFASDPKYQTACKAWAANPSKAALYIPPDDYAPSGGSGSADGGNYTDPAGDFGPPADGSGGDGGGDDGGGDGGGGGGGGGGSGGGGGEDPDPVNEDGIRPTSRLDAVKPARTDADNALTTNSRTASVSALPTPLAMQASSLRGAGQLIQSMASFGAPSGALSQEHGVAGTIHPSEMGLAAAHRPGRMAA